jgi:hypothetical protein
MNIPPCKIPIPIAPTYVNWSWWHAIRELFQNGLDARDRGYKLNYTYEPEEKKLIIQNVGAHLPRDTLILGSTTKAGDNTQRGEFGEGYKLAITTLCRLGAKVTIYNGSETWVPEISYSDTFGASILHITIHPSGETHHLTYEVIGLPVDEWGVIKDHLLTISESYPAHIRTDHGMILTDARYSSKLFANGIYVASLPDKHVFGYDLLQIKLDRDRQSPNITQLRYQISRMLKFAVDHGALSPSTLLGAVSLGQGEGLAFENERFRAADSFHAKMAGAFEAKYGHNAVPVTTTEEATKASHYTLVGVVVNAYLFGILSRVMSLSKKIAESKIMTVERGYEVSELTADEIANLRWAIALTSYVEPIDLARMHVVDFIGNRIYGMFERSGDGESIYLARRILSERETLIATMIHEVCHKYGPDGDTVHRDATEIRLAKLITLLYQAGTNGTK